LTGTSCALPTIPLLSFDIRLISRVVEGVRPRVYADVTTLKLRLADHRERDHVIGIAIPIGA